MDFDEVVGKVKGCCNGKGKGECPNGQVWAVRAGEGWQQVNQMRKIT